MEGSPNVSNTRPVKDLDNLLRIVFDVLRYGPQVLGSQARSSPPGSSSRRWRSHPASRHTQASATEQEQT